MSVSLDTVMTLREMEQKFISEWILVGDPETNQALEVLSGKVLHHSPDRDEVYKKVVQLWPKRSAILYTRRKPTDMEFICQFLIAIQTENLKVHPPHPL